MDTAEPFAVDWRSLFTSIGVAWVDKGRNTSKDNVNINCPHCGDDQGFHMRVSEEFEIFNCWRDRRHGGTQFSWLLYSLGISRADAISLLNEYRVSRRAVAQPVKKETSTAEWDYFKTVDEAPAHHPVYQYFISRGFTIDVARKYDLRYAPAGKWAMRVLIPLYYGGRLQTWTGRSVKAGIDPRYLVKEIDDPGQIYIPRLPRKDLYLVEGPIDALKIAVALEGTDASAVALCSRGLNASRILALQALECENLFLMLDNDTPLSQQFDMLNTLASSKAARYVERRKLPMRYKDAGEVPVRELRQLLG